MITISGLKVEFGSNLLFGDVSFSIGDKERIALTGRNGAGKSTLLKIIAGLQKPTSGVVAIPTDATVGYLPQQMNVTDNRTVIEEVKTVFGEVDRLRSRLDEVNARLAEATDSESDEYARLVDQMTALNEAILLKESNNYIAEIEKTLIGLGFVRSDFERMTSEFSGGWRMRIELAKLLLRRPDVLLLDEPTNHLDIESIQWLESFLRQKAKAVVLVSHDRAFLDNVTQRTIEISCGKIYDYAVNYSKFVELRRERVEQQLRAYRNQQKQIEETEDFIERFRYKATKAVQVQSRIKQLAKIERIEVDEVDNRQINLRFPPAPRSGDYPVIAEGLSKSYGDHLVFGGVDFTIKRGEKVAFVGKNGEGKSTMVKCIMGEIPYDGELKIGHGVKIGYFAQNQASLLDGEITVFDTIDRVAVGDIRTRINDILGAFMFGGESSEKKVKVLSGGEKTRLAMIRLLLEPVNLLILDEPTNHFDMRTKDVLKQAIKEFTGTAIIVSHDREFLDGLVEKVYEFGGGKVREHLGGIYDFLQAKNMTSLQQIEATDTKKAESMSDAPSSDGKLSYQEKKERERAVRKAKKEVADAKNAIAELEQKIAEIEARFATGEVNDALCQEHAALTSAYEKAMHDWEAASENLETLENQQ